MSEWDYDPDTDDRRGPVLPEPGWAASQVRMCPACGQPSTVLRSLGFCGHCSHRCIAGCFHPKITKEEQDHGN